MSFHPIFHLDPRPHRELSAANSSRKQHIRFTYDILHVCLQRGDLVRARRAWTILVRCPEIDMRTIWQIGLALIPREGEEGKRGKATREHVGYLKRVRLQIPEMQETLLKETVLALIDMGEYQEALDELDLYIVTMPFDQNAVLHLYAGMLWLYTAQPRRDMHENDEEEKVIEDDIEPIDTRDYDLTRVASAKRHFRRALALDPDNAFARGFLDRLGADVQETQREATASMDLDDGELIAPDPIVLSDEEAMRPIKKARSQSK
ncbi:RNA polymerase I specific initiation factor [Ceratobasidium sp. AG-Ba]|nr:RNA polymerase I specific initiation factor [Ceratobasidium sp. AG-Ba]QRV91067.1 RNA polymerase I specific initiation factor [Ceratobasidium sp. AG-Ba]QRW05155.1 RNA polymerase I specific initiation factor [Ceratobasidium sp. AG-Ba]